MSNRSSYPAASPRQPFRLLDLPRELLVPIIRSYRSPIPENWAALVIYEGEESNGRYRVLRDLCLTHRDILPFAQEELFKRLDIRSDVRMDLLNRSVASSERCKEYAGRAESIYLDDDADKLMESGALDPRELCCEDTMNFSTLNRFQNLRRLDLYEAQFDEALTLPNLESYTIGQCGPIEIDTRTALNLVNLPNLRRLTIFGDVDTGTFGRLYDSILSQIAHLSLYCLHETVLERLLLLSTSLQSLHCGYSSSKEGLSKVLNLFSRIGMQELHFSRTIKLRCSDNWETDFELIEKFKKVVEEKDGLKRVGLEFRVKFIEEPSQDVCNQTMARWMRIKDELELMCGKKGIEVLVLTCHICHCYTVEQEEQV